MNKLLITCFFCLFACSSMPLKEFATTKYLPRDGACFDRLLDDDSIETKCYYDNGEDSEKDWIVVPYSSFQKELLYQQKLIQMCKGWR